MIFIINGPPSIYSLIGMALGAVVVLILEAIRYFKDRANRIAPYVSPAPPLVSQSEFDSFKSRDRHGSTRSFTKGNEVWLYDRVSGVALLRYDAGGQNES